MSRDPRSVEPLLLVGARARRARRDEDRRGQQAHQARTRLHQAPSIPHQAECHDDPQRNERKTDHDTNRRPTSGRKGSTCRTGLPVSTEFRSTVSGSESTQP